jgi:MFS family permease|tara:strand:+ start:2368 stop:3570 length:1203 start_codon:yes stop_codon:yes gene_type:complete
MYEFIKKNHSYLQAGFFLTFAASIGQTFYFALYAGNIRDELGLSHGSYGGLYTAATLLSALTMLYTGKMVDYVNVRYLSFFVLILLGLSSIAFSFINSAFFLLIVFYLLRITGQGMSTHTSSTFIAKTFSSMRGKAIAVTVLGRAFGEMIMPITALLLIAFVGWRNAWIYTGLFILFIIAPYVFYLLKQRDIYEPDLNKKLNTTIYENQINYRRSDVIKNKFFYLILSSILAPPFICTGIFFHSYHLIEIKGWSTEIYALTMPIFSLLLIIFVIFSGWAVDKWSAKDLTSFYLIPLAIGCIILAIGKNEVAMILFMVCAGATTGFATSIAGSLWAELYGTKYLGEVKALVMSCVVASTAIAPGIMGYLIDISVSLSDQILVCSVYMIMITGLLLWKRKAI